MDLLTQSSSSVGLSVHYVVTRRGHPTSPLAQKRDLYVCALMRQKRWSFVACLRQVSLTKYIHI